MKPEDLLARLEAGYEYDPMYGQLCNERDQLKAENAKLVRVLHEVEREAVHAYRCLQKDCETMTASASHYFEKWWYVECQSDRLKAKNAKLRTQLADVTESMGRVEERCAKLRELVRELWEGYADPPCEDCPLKDKPACVDCPICAREAAVIDLMRELGVEAD